MYRKKKTNIANIKFKGRRWMLSFSNKEKDKIFALTSSTQFCTGVSKNRAVKIKEHPNW